MIRPFFLAAVAVAAAPVSSPAPAHAEADPLAQVSQHLRAVTTMTAGFVQTDRDGKQLSGTLTLKRPGRIRFQYQKGVPLLIVGDGKALTMIDYSVAQVSRWPIGNSPLSVLLDPNKDLARFARPVEGADPRLIVIRGTDPKHPEFGTITIGFTRTPGAPGGLVLAGWTVIDAQNNRSSVQLSNQRFNVPVSDDMFRWNDPRRRGPVK